MHGNREVLHWGDACQVFDDWKSFSLRQASAKGQNRTAGARARLSNVSLAFLEACCRSSPDHAWRVFDVCAEMRLQSELRREVIMHHTSSARLTLTGNGSDVAAVLILPKPDSTSPALADAIWHGVQCLLAVGPRLNH